MNSDDKDEATGGDHNEDATVAALMNLAGPRAEVPEGVERRVYANVMAEWQAATRPGSGWKKWALPAVLAASLALAVGVGLRNGAVPGPVMATVTVVNGAIAADGLTLDFGDAIRAGSYIETGEGGLTLAMDDRVSVRLAANTALRAVSAGTLELLSGKLYADSGMSGAATSPLRILTAAGTATDIGTQFMVEVAGTRTSIAVREGKVRFEGDDDTTTAVAGQRVSGAAGGDLVTEDIAVYGGAWAWAEALAPAFDSRGKSLLELLEWASRETGRVLVFASDEVREAAARTRIGGQMSAFTPDDAVQAALATTTFRYRMLPHSISVSR